MTGTDAFLGQSCPALLGRKKKTQFNHEQNDYLTDLVSMISKRNFVNLQLCY